MKTKTTHLNDEAMDGLRFCKSDSVATMVSAICDGKKPTYAIYRGLIEQGYLNADGTVSAKGDAALAAA